MGCPSCGQENRDGARFCDSCGRPLEGAPSSPPTPDVNLAVPAHLAEKIRDGLATLEGERKHVTIMFADVKGSMDLSEDVDPEEWRRVLDRFYEILTEGVHRFEGTVNQYLGDGIMAIFGAPIAHEDHARRACFAALHLCETLGLYTRELRREKSLSFTARIGLHSGEVVVGGIGPDLHMEYTAVGHAASLARRMEQLAAPGTAYITDTTAQLVRGFFELEDLGTFDVKGVREPVRVFEIKGPGSNRVRFDIDRARGLSRFVGRREETAVLSEALDAVAAGRGQIVTVVGEAGVGKSRLCHEFAERARDEGMKVFVSHGHPHGLAFPFQPVMQLLRGYFGIGDIDGPVAARQKIAGSLLLLDETFRSSLPLVFEFLGVPDPDLPFPQLDPDARLGQLYGLLGHLIQARSDRGPALVLIEDMQWLDGGSEAFISHLVRAVPNSRTLLLMNYRPEYRPDWINDSYRQINLGPLEDEAVEDLIEQRLGADDSVRALGSYVRERTGGNPFFVEEVVQSMIGAGALVGRAGAYRLVGRLDELSVPPNVQAVIAARVDRLPEREKRLLQTAAVIGQEFARSVLERVSGLPTFEIDAALRALADAEFIVERSVFPDPEYTFKHPLTQEVAYRSQLGDRRRTLHAAAARAIAEIHADRTDERAAVLARHWEQAGDGLEAARWHRRAAEWASHNDTASGLRHWERVRELVGAYPAGDDAEALALAACLGVLNLGSRHGLTEARAQALFDEGRTLAEHQKDRRSLARLLLVFARVRGTMGDVASASDLSVEAAKIAREVGLRGLRLAVAVNLASWATEFGDRRRSLEVVEEALAEQPPHPRLGAEHLGYSPYIWLVMNRGRLLTYMGRCEEAQVAFDRALRLARDHGELEIVCWAHQGCVDLAWMRGDIVSASAHAAQAVEIAERIGTLLAIWSSYHAYGRAQTLRGDARDAIVSHERALSTMRENRTGLHLQPLVLGSLAEALLVSGDYARAASTANDAILVAATVSNDPALGVRARTILTRARRLGGDTDLASEEQRLREGLEVLEATGYRSIEPAVRIELAELARIRGDLETCTQEIDTARRILDEMGAAQGIVAFATA